MSDKTVDDYQFEDIIIPIPKNTVQLVITTTVYENDEISKLKGTYDISDIIQCKKTFEDCLNGEYPTYRITEMGKEFLRSIER